MHYFSYNENKLHGTLDFPVACYHVNEQHSHYKMPFHWHKEWELIHIISGNFTLYVDGKEYNAASGDIFLLQEGTLHGGTPSNCIYQCLTFDLHGIFSNILSLKADLSPFYRNMYLPYTFFPNGQSDIVNIVKEIFSAFLPEYSDSYRKLITVGNLSRLFAIILEKKYYTVNNGCGTSRVKKINALKPVLEYIESHFNESITLSQLSAIAQMNPNYFCNFFQSMTQQTPMNYVNSYRIEQAANILCNSDLSITEVGFQCGFNDICHFIKTFKKHKNITPKQYKKYNSCN